MMRSLIRRSLEQLARLVDPATPPPTDYGYGYGHWPATDLAIDTIGMEPMRQLTQMGLCVHFHLPAATGTARNLIGEETVRILHAAGFVILNQDSLQRLQREADLEEARAVYRELTISPGSRSTH